MLPPGVTKMANKSKEHVRGLAADNPIIIIALVVDSIDYHLSILFVIQMLRSDAKQD